MAQSKGVAAYHEVRQRIADGRLTPGARIDQYALAEDLGMSITPLREAIRQLSSEGWIRMETHRDCIVAPVTAKESRELLETRFALEPVATELAALRRTPAELDALEEAAGRLKPVTREWGEAAIAAHRDFHRIIYAASHNAVMIRTLDDVWDKSDRYRRLHLAGPAGEESRILDLEQHHQLFELMKLGDAPAAAELSRAHIRASLGALMTTTLGQLERDYSPFNR